ncbi:DUF6211 family protein [Streptomyces sp. NPDC056773]|uniref:DUF6211 family protein n=1 Tax=unclassified Streptomyces TaxID=2593676 RepID=UPI0036B29F12
MLSHRAPDYPRPGDFAQLKTGNSIAASTASTYVVVDDLPPSEHIVLNLPAEHPDRDDWAATIPLDDIASLTRIGPGGAYTWTVPPNPDAST